MKRIALALGSMLIVAQAGCSNNTRVPLTPDQQEMICKATVAALMGTDHVIIDSSWVIDTKELLPYVQTSYIRKNDGTKWMNDCKFDQKNGMVIWRGVDIDYPGSGPGRWRDGEYDSEIYYRLNDNTVEITERYTDGSSGAKDFFIFN